MINKQHCQIYLSMCRRACVGEDNQLGGSPAHTHTVEQHISYIYANTDRDKQTYNNLD